jgi:hypothetical protein
MQFRHDMKFALWLERKYLLSFAASPDRTRCVEKNLKSLRLLPQRYPKRKRKRPAAWQAVD